MGRDEFTSGTILLPVSVATQVSGSNPDDGAWASASSYELLAESCVPGIVTNNWREIFEEQCVVPSLAETLGTDDRRANGNGRGAAAGGRVCFAEEERMFSYGR